MDFVEEMTARGLVHQTTADELGPLMQKERFTGYIGFDPTADSLHVGSLLPVLALVRLQRAGHRPIAIVGGGTGLIGDPSGKSSERNLLTRDQLAQNLAGIRGQLEGFLDFDGKDGARLLNNADWLCEQNLLEFLRDIGKHFSVNAMIVRDSVRQRLEGSAEGMSFTEFSYILLQAFDFLEVYDRFGCRLQMGGSDQWGNIVSGIDLIRRKRGATAYGLTSPLVTRSDGRKFGKSEAGNVWLDPKRTSPYEFFQFWMNTPDQDVGRYLRFFTFLPLDRLKELDEVTDSQPWRREAQKVLASQVTRMVHGDAALQRALRATEVLFGKGSVTSLSGEELAEAFASSPTTTLNRALLGQDDARLVTVAADGELVRSRSAARKLVKGGGLYINDQPVTDKDRVLDSDDLLEGGFIVLRRGKKSYLLVRVVDGD